MGVVNDFQKAGQEKPPTILEEFIDFLKHNKKWWLLPIVLVLGMVGILAFFAGSGAAPFIYTMF